MQLGALQVQRQQYLSAEPDAIKCSVTTITLACAKVDAPNSTNISSVIGKEFLQSVLT